MIASGELAKVQGYIDGVLSGDIVVGELVRAAVQRHVNDLAKQSTKSFPYHFDANAAEAACLYFPTCLRHSIGDYAGMPFELEPWQAFGVACVWGWKRDVDNTRRFRRVYWSTGRKNGKSTFAGGLALLLASMDVNPLTGKPENVAEVILCATKREQVEMIMFAEIQRMRHQSPAIKASSKVVNKRLEFTANKGSIRCVGSNKPYDGLNPSAVIKDELHEFRESVHRKFLDTMDTGGGSRAQPLDIITTTAGDDSSTIWKDTYNYFARVAKGEIIDESCFGYCFEIDPKDDPLDEENWPKANPNLGLSVKVDYLRDQATQAKESPSKLNQFIRYHGNRIVSATTRAFDLDGWDNCRAKLSDWSKADAIGIGVDIGSRDDLTALGMVARFPTGEEDDSGSPIWRYEIKAKAYISLDTPRDLSQPPWSRWIYDGHLSRSKFPNVEMKDDVFAFCREYRPFALAFDPYNGLILQDEFSKAGINAVSMAQTCAMFHEPIQEFRQAMRDGRLSHDGNPVLRWCIGNAAIIRDRQDRWMFCKRDSDEKIDSAVAVVMAYRMAMLSPRRPVGKLFLY